MVIISYQLHQPEALAMSRALSTAARSSRPLTLPMLEATPKLIRDASPIRKVFWIQCDNYVDRQEGHGNGNGMSVDTETLSLTSGGG
jgi:hypothetical protein